MTEPADGSQELIPDPSRAISKPKNYRARVSQKMSLDDALTEFRAQLRHIRIDLDPDRELVAALDRMLAATQDLRARVAGQPGP